MGMLETVVSEKQIPRAILTSPGVQAPSRSSTLSANQRLKGLLSRSSTIKPVEKAVRSSTQTIVSPRSPSSPPPVIVQHAFTSADASLNEVSTLSNCVLSASPPSQNGPEDRPPDVATVEP